MTFGSGNETHVPKDNPNYDASLGHWATGDFDGDGRTDLVHFVTRVPNVVGYVHVHFSRGKDSFQKETGGYVFREHANP